MENNEKKYWKGLEELNETPEFVNHKQKEFAEELPIEDILSESNLVDATTPRRDFLKALGFGVSTVALAACNKAPVHKAIPYLIKPEEVTPGVPNYYTSNFNGLGVLVKTREGRPIKIEGNPNDPIGMGGTNATAQASVLELYDSSRLKTPMLLGTPSNWDTVDKYVKDALAEIAVKNGSIRILSSTIMSPSTKSVIADFVKKYPNTKHITYDASSSSAIISANKNSFDAAVIPGYKFDRADVIVSFGADFLGTWISPVEYTKQYVTNRNHRSLENKKMSRHVQFETGLSMTGTNADMRVAIKPSEEGLAVVALYNALVKIAGSGSSFTIPTTLNFAKQIDAVANELWSAKGKSLVISGSNDVSVQVMINAINSLLGNYGTTIDIDNPSYQKQGNDAEMIELVQEMNAGKINALFIYGANPIYSFVHAKEFSEGLKKIALSVSFSDRADETALQCKVIAPDHHYLESWNDVNAKKGIYAIVQPTIHPIYNSRAAQQSLLNWSDNSIDYYQYIKNYWERVIYTQQNTYPNFRQFWEKTLQIGVAILPQATAQSYKFNKDLNTVVETIVNASKKASSKVELNIYEKIGVGDGRYANNPWLQELPDPVSKATWDNYAAINPNYAKELGIKENEVIELKSGATSVKIPVLMQPGQANGTVSVALGYGRTNVGKVGDNVGVNVYPMLTVSNGSFQYMNSSVEIVKTGDTYVLAQTQTHHTIEGRDTIRENSLKEYLHKEEKGHGKEGKHEVADLWPKYETPGHHWIMAIDLNACTGCGACVVACNAENNIPVVGREEVRRRREMHWMRIDRYYTFEGNNGAAITKETQYKQVENYEQVKVVHQPMLCQHCSHAPCETVCPVLATMHSSEGLNQMAYNRCVGTRYCANNCPFKVRRFNWFNYWNDARFENYLQNESSYLALNPDVTPRFRGVMEKCSFCAQRIQAGKLNAKVEKRSLRDGDVKTACQQGCPANAIVFGDVNDPESEVSKLIKSDRTYFVLEELNVQPSIGYMTKIRNTTEA